ncbi:MAG: hypothetical protein GY953_31750, partial [bacterium]|nr:hypothetical protein [bacterium]
PVREQFVYVTDREGSSAIWLRNVAEGTDRPLVAPDDFPEETPSFFATPDFSPDGGRIVYAASASDTLASIWISPVSGGKPTRVTSADELALAPAWSPDGNWIAYLSMKDGRMQLTKTRVGGREPSTVVAEENCQDPPNWSSDGQWLSCANNRDLVLVPANGGEPRRFAGVVVRYAAWGAGGRVLYGIRRVEGEPTLVSFDASTGALRTLANYGPDLQIGTSLNPGLRLSLSPDGKALTAAQVVSTSDLWVLEGFQPPRSLWQRLRPW